jgi:hypothetical protein
MTASLKQISAITLFVEDLPASKAFYASVMACARRLSLTVRPQLGSRTKLG